MKKIIKNALLLSGLYIAPCIRFVYEEEAGSLNTEFTEDEKDMVSIQYKNGSVVFVEVAPGQIYFTVKRPCKSREDAVRPFRTSSYIKALKAVLNELENEQYEALVKNIDLFRENIRAEASKNEDAPDEEPVMITSKL